MRVRYYLSYILAHVLGVLLFIPIWLFNMFYCRRWLNPITGAALYWVGISAVCIAVKESAKEQGLW